MKNYNIRLKEVIKPFTKRLFYNLFDEQEEETIFLKETFLEISSKLGIENGDVESTWRRFKQMLKHPSGCHAVSDNDESLAHTRSPVRRSAKQKKLPTEARRFAPGSRNDWQLCHGGAPNAGHPNCSSSLRALTKLKA